MSEPAHPPDRLDRTTLSIRSRFDEEDDAGNWRGRSVAERLRHMETLRRINDGSAATERLQRVLQVVRVPWR